MGPVIKLGEGHLTKPMPDTVDEYITCSIEILRKTYLFEMYDEILIRSIYSEIDRINDNIKNYPDWDGKKYLVCRIDRGTITIGLV